MNGNKDSGLNGSSTKPLVASNQRISAQQNETRPMTPAGSAKKDVNGVRRPPIGGVKVTTVKRAVAPPQTQKTVGNGSSNGSSLSASSRMNALPEETRRRIEEARNERERKQVEESVAARAAAAAANRSKGAISRSVSSARKGNDSRHGTPKKRRKARVSDSEGSDDDDLFGGSGTSSPASRKRLDSSREQSASATGSYKKLGRLGVQSFYEVPRQVIDEAAFQGQEEVDVDTRAIQGAELVQSGKVYGHFFRNLEGEPKVELEYPADGVRETFTLLVPKERDEYDPISDLLRVVRCIVAYYLTPEQQQLFGSLDSLETGSAAGNLLSSDHRSSTPLGRVSATPPVGSRAGSREGTPAANVTNADDLSPSKTSHLGALSPARSAILASATESASLATAAAESTHAEKMDSPSLDSILRSFTKARNRRDGQLFLKTVERFNDTLRSLKRSGQIRANVRALSSLGVPEGIWRCVQEQCYARTVGPHVEELSRYTAFSDNVYGELLPRFMSEIAQLTGLGPNSVFVDLGSGVGNLLIQVALQTGSQSYGCEQMAAPSKLARAQVSEAQRRWKMWGLQGARTEAWEDDFGESAQVRDILRSADVVLVNNYAFTSTTNDKLSWLFLDLKDGAHIVSLKPFVPPDFRVTERTMSSPLAILKVAQRSYTNGCVSWADGGGSYYIHTVDRSLLAKLDTAAPRKENGRKRQWKAAKEVTSAGEEE